VVGKSLINNINNKVKLYFHQVMHDENASKSGKSSLNGPQKTLLSRIV
jgi:hypothetical protein